MMMFKRATSWALKALPALLFLLSGANAHAVPLLVATWENNSEVLRVESTTGVATSIGLAGTRISGLTTSGSTIFGWGQNGSLYTIDPASGAATLVGASGSSGTEGAIAAHPTNGFLYASDSSANELVQVNPATGAGAVVGPFNAGDISGLAFLGDVLYGLNASPTDELVTIDILTGLASLVGPLGVSVGPSASVGGLVAVGPGLLMVDGNGIRSLDLVTGAASTAIAFSGNLSGRDIGGVTTLAVPEPASILLLGAGLAGFGFARRARKR